MSHHRGRGSDRHQDVVNASTPLIHSHTKNNTTGSRNNSYHHQQQHTTIRCTNHNNNRSSWENETPINHRNSSGRHGSDSTEDIIKRSAMASSSTAFISQSSNSYGGSVNNFKKKHKQNFNIIIDLIVHVVYLLYLIVCIYYCPLQ